MQYIAIAGSSNLSGPTPSGGAAANMVTDTFPQECRFVLETLGQVYGFDEEAWERGMMPDERLEFHQRQSGPLMEKLKEWFNLQLMERKTDPNSGLGRAIRYMQNHWKKLTLFFAHGRRSAGQQYLRARVEAGGAASEECVVLPDHAWHRHRRSVYESDSHVRIEYRQSVRVSDCVVAACAGVEVCSGGLDALEFQGVAGSARCLRASFWK